MHVVKEKLSKVWCLILVPEIILTSEWVKEIEKDFEITPAGYHSSIEKKEQMLVFLEIALDWSWEPGLRYHFHLSIWV